MHWPSGIPFSHQKGTTRSPAPKQNFFRSIWLWDSPILMKRKTHWPCPTERAKLSAAKRPKTLKLGCYLTSICINGITFMGVKLSVVWLLRAFLPSNFTLLRQMPWTSQMSRKAIVGEGIFTVTDRAIRIIMRNCYFRQIQPIKQFASSSFKLPFECLSA